MVFAMIFKLPHKCSYTIRDSLFIVCAHIHCPIRIRRFAIYNLAVFKIALFNQTIPIIFFAFYKFVVFKITLFLYIIIKTSCASTFYKHLIFIVSIYRSISHSICCRIKPHSVSIAIYKITAVSKSKSFVPVYVCVNSVAMEFIILKFTFI